MSENEDESEDESLLDNFDIKEWINSFLGSFRGELESEDARQKFEQGNYEGPVILASNGKVIEEALEDIREIRQYKKASELGIEDEGKIKTIKVELDVPQDIEHMLKEFDNILAEVRTPIINEIKRRNRGPDKNPMLEEDEPIMTYIFEENAGSYGDVTIFGGAKALMFNLTDEYGYTEDERELIRKAHEVAADYNGVERHTLVEDVAIVPQFKHEDVEILED